MIALAYGLVGDWELAGQILSIFFGVLLLLPLYCLLRDAFDERVALIACFLAAVSPFLARYSVHVRTESIFIFFLVVAMFLCQQGLIRQSPLRFFGAASSQATAISFGPKLSAFW